MATYTDNYNLIKPTYAETADIVPLNNNFEKIDEVMHASQTSLAPAYNQTASYQPGNVVMYELNMYKCTGATSGTWDPSKWTRTTAAETGGGGSVDFDIFGEGSGSVVTITDGAEAGLAECIVEIEATQSGSGTPSPSNVRPIVGRSEVNVSVSGKNMINVDAPTVPNASLDANGEWIATNYYNGFVFKGGFVYTLSMTKGNGFDTLRYAVRTGGTGARQTNNMNAPLVIDATSADEVIIILGKTDFATNVQLEIGSEATTYEPYSGSITTIPLDRTVYGGTLDVTRRVLTVNKVYVELDGSEQWSNTTPTVASTNVGSMVNFTAIFDKFKLVNKPYTSMLEGEALNYNGYISFYKPSEYNTMADYIAVIGNIQVEYQIPTPQTYTFTTEEVSTILGYNNIYADSGEVSVVYVKQTAPIKPNPTGADIPLTGIEIDGEKFSIPQPTEDYSDLSNFTWSEIAMTTSTSSAVAIPQGTKILVVMAIYNGKATIVGKETMANINKALSVTQLSTFILGGHWRDQTSSDYGDNSAQISNGLLTAYSSYATITTKVYALT